jgi:MlaD protein
MGRKSIETMVGLFVLLGLLAIVFLALKAANLASFRVGSTYAVTAKFDNIGGLKVRAPVKSAGVTVGRVTAIALDAKSYQGLVIGEDPDLGPARRPVHRSRTGRCGPEPQARRRDQDDTVRRRAGEPDRAVPVQQGRRAGRGA